MLILSCNAKIRPLALSPFHQIIGQAPTPTPQEKMTIVGWASEPVLAIASKKSIIQYQSRTDGFFKITKLDVGIVAFDEEVCRFWFEPLVVKAQEGFRDS